MTASTATVVILGLLTGSTLRISIPGVGELPGGYPVEVHKGKFKLELPSGITKEEAIAHKSNGERQDGVELGEGVRFTERTRNELAEVGFAYAQGFAYGETTTHPARSASSRVMSRLRQPTEPREQRREMRPIFLSNGDEFQPHATSGLRVTHYRFGSDLPLLYKKINLRRGANGRWFVCLKKCSAETQIPDAQNVIPSRRTPIHANFVGFDARGLPA